MRPRRLFAFGLKWLIVPAALAATGYFVVGPRLSGPIETTPPEEAAPVPTGVASPPKRKFNGEPEVEVSVRKGGSSSARSRSRRSTRSSDDQPADSQ